MNRLSWIVAAFGLASIAAAQNELVPVNMSVRLGVAYPFDNATRDVTGNMFAIGLDFNTNFSLFKQAQGYLSADFYAKTLSGHTRSFIPVMFNQRFTIGTNDMRGTTSYFFVGGGAIAVDVNGSKWVYGGRAGIGMEVGPHLFAEGTVLFGDKANGARPDSVAVFVGYRF